MTETYVHTRIPAVDSRGHENLADESLVDANVLAGKAQRRLAGPRDLPGGQGYFRRYHDTSSQSIMGVWLQA